jgi:hypothetical protein
MCMGSGGSVCYLVVCVCVRVMQEIKGQIRDTLLGR